jgi:hypothetical protein
VVRPTAGDARDQAGRNVRGKKWGEERCMYGGKNGLLRAGWEKEKRGKEKKNKRKSWPAARGWLGEKENRERERKKKKKACCFVPGWVGERKQREKKKKKKSPAVYVAGCMARKKNYISPAGEMGCVAGEGKKIYCRPDGCMAGQGKKIIKKRNKKIVKHVVGIQNLKIWQEKM